MKKIVPIDYTNVIKKFNRIANRGFCYGIGTVDGQMCVEAAICTAMGDLPFSDQPKCVTPAISFYKVTLNDCCWSSPKARTKGLRKLGIAQLGSKDVISNAEFYKLVKENHIKVLIPYFLKYFYNTCGIIENMAIPALINECSRTGNSKSLRKVRKFLDGFLPLFNNSDQWELLSYFKTECYNLSRQRFSSRNSIILVEKFNNILNEGEFTGRERDKFLNLVASSTLEILKKLKSPGCKYL